MMGALRLLTRGLLFAAVATAGAAHATLPIEHWTAPSGARVVFIASPTIPMLDVRVDVDGGTRRDPGGKSGLAALTAGLITAGTAAPTPGSPASGAGARAITEGELADAFSDLGAQFQVNVSPDFASARLRTLAAPDKRDTAIALMAAALQRPAFPDSAVQRDRQIAIASLRESLTRPATLARVAFGRAVFGKHPYGASSTEASLSAISRDDIVDFYRRSYTADRAVVSIVGAIDRRSAEAIADQLTAGLGRHADLPGLPAVEPLAQPVVERIAHPSAQAHILIGQPGIARGDPDYFALLVGNQILGGGGFASRLTEQVREKRGLSYSVYSYFIPLKQPGAFELGLQTRKDQAGEALAVADRTLADFVSRGPTTDELRAAKDNLIKGFALRIDSNAKLLDNIANIAWYGLPYDYLDTWTDKVAQVGIPEIRAAFSRHLRPSMMATVVVGGPQ